MPIETTTDLVQPLAAARPSGGGNDNEPGSATQIAIGKARRFSERALAASGAMLLRVWTGKRRTRPLSRTMTVLGWIAVIAVCFYVGLTTMIYLAQRSLMYFPDTAHTTPAEAGLPEATEVPLTASDGVQIRVWHVPPQAGKPVILYFHGNGGSLQYRVERFRPLIGAGIGLVALEYRGYGGLPGSPSEQGLIRDAEAAYTYAAARYPAQQIVVWASRSARA